MSSPITIGNCSPCCFSGSVAEAQTVRAAVKFKGLGWMGISDLVTAIYLPNVVYLKRNVYQADATGIFYQQLTEVDTLGNTIVETGFDNRDSHSLGSPEISFESIYDGFGNLVKTIRTYPNGVSVDELSNPYTYEQARDAAVALLAAVQLLNPLLTYNVTVSGSATLVPKSLRYPSEYSRYSGTSVNELCVYKNAAGNTLISSYNDAWEFLMGTSTGLSPAPRGNAVNGASHDMEQDSPSVDGLVWASKSAWHSPRIIPTRRDGINILRPGTATRRTKRIYGTYPNPDQDFFAVLPLPGLSTPNPIASGNPAVPLTPPLSPGEHIFLPSDVPGNGCSIWAGVEMEGV